MVGGGAAGISAAYLLQRKYRVTLFEKNDYLGGHTHTVEIPSGPDAGTPVDTGFIVMNEKNYPELCGFFSELGVMTQPTDMSLSVHVPCAPVLYSSDLPWGLFAQSRNLWSPSFYGMLWEIIRFYRQAVSDLKDGRPAKEMTLGGYLNSGGYSEKFREYHLVPMAAAIWSLPPGKVLDFPALTFLRFYENHGLLSLTEKPQWRTVKGGSRSYVRAFQKTFRGEVRLKARVNRIRRRAEGVELLLGNQRMMFEKVVIASHADEALAMIEDPSAGEKRLLGAWQYSENRTVLHTDEKIMPPARRAWAAWNVYRGGASDGDTPVAVTYDMNRLQKLKTSGRYFVTLNREDAIDPARVTGRFLYHHPTYTFESLGSQAGLRDLNSRGGGIYYCGSYFGHGFHEDAVRSGFQAAGCLGVSR